MPSFRTAAFLFAAAIFMAVFQGCAEQVKIADLARDPGGYRNKDVTISGRVTQSFGALGTGVYEVDDGTGKLWVISEQSGVPGQGAQVAVTGRITEGATLGTRSLGLALHETSRKR